MAGWKWLLALVACCKAKSPILIHFLLFLNVANKNGLPIDFSQHHLSTWMLLLLFFVNMFLSEI
jgi:hypothetical protein